MTVFRRIRELIFSSCTIVVAAVFAAGCDSEGLGSPILEESGTRILLTDAPFPFDEVASVDVHVVRVEASETADTVGSVTYDSTTSAGSSNSSENEWITIVEPNARFNLLDLQRGATALVGDGDLPAGQYRAIRLTIDTDLSSITMNDGRLAVIHWPVNGELAMHALVEEPLAVRESGANIVIDFDVGRSFSYGTGIADTVGADPYDFLFIPWIRAVNEAATGGIEGTVFQPGEDGEAIPLKNATVSVMRGDSALGALSWWAVATGATDSEGRFRIDFLLEGSYIVKVDPPRGADLGIASQYNMPVELGDFTEIELTVAKKEDEAASFEIVAPSTVNVGEPASIRAVLLDAEGDTLIGQPISWWGSPPEIAELTSPGGGTPLGDITQLLGKRAGVYYVMAWSFGLHDSTSIFVADPNAPPVASMALTPETQTINVLDSLVVSAHLFDSEGETLTGRLVSWEVSDSTVMSIGFVVQPFGSHAYFYAKRPGSVSVIARSEGKSATSQITVVP